MNPLTFNKKAPTLQLATHQKMVNRIQYWLSLATDQEREDGLSWYYGAQQFCATVASELGFTTEALAQVTAILSPQIDWEQNKRNAVLLATTRSAEIKIFATGEQKQKALAALGGEYVLTETSRKTYSFADNIANPESQLVTVDRHATKVALNDRSAEPVRITDKQYRDIQEAYRTVAKKAGLLPYQVQAICWVTYKRVVGR